MGRHCFLQHKQQKSDVPRDKNIRDLNQGKEQATLLVHLVLSIVTETRCSRIPELQEENAAQRHHA
jgi:hypothetical protein